MPVWVAAWFPIVVQIIVGIWFLSRFTAKVDATAKQEEKTQEAMTQAFADISVLARQVAVNDSEHKSFIFRLENAEREISALRTWKHELANRQMLYDNYQEEIVELRRRVERIAERSS